MAQDRGVYLKYIDRRFNDETMEIIRHANIIIAEYEGQGFSLTLRQLYYQYVARGLLANKQSNYNRLGSIVSDGRLAGLISWAAIEDRGRSLSGFGYHKDPAAAFETAKDGYMLDLWADQEWRPEVWVEKQALIEVIGRICRTLRVDFFATKGYNSQSEQWRAGQRFARYIQKGQRPIIFHLGDHDPSGIDMTRDNRDRLSMFAGVPILVVRLALNYNQVEEFNPPPNPTKWSDSRADAYVEKYGSKSWELDALDPRYIAKTIKDSILRIRDEERWDEALAREVADKRAIDEAIDSLRGGPLA